MFLNLNLFKRKKHKKKRVKLSHRGKSLINFKMFEMHVMLYNAFYSFRLRLHFERFALSLLTREIVFRHRYEAFVLFMNLNVKKDFYHF